MKKMVRHSVKPGRGPSAMGVMGGVIAIVFGIFWTLFAIYITSSAPFPNFIKFGFPMFGVLFVITGIVRLFYDAYNATQDSRFSEYDVISTDDEFDSLGGSVGNPDDAGAFSYCVNCGNRIRESDRFCSRCGNQQRPS